MMLERILLFLAPEPTQPSSPVESKATERSLYMTLDARS